MDEQKPSIWEQIREYFADISVVNPISEFFRGPPEESIAFTISIIALSAKMAKADGKVTRDEVRTLRQIFEFKATDERDIGRVFDLARQDVAGFDIYARRIKKMFRGREEILQDIFESMFVISVADGEFHDNEALMLEEIREIFELPPKFFGCLKNRYLVDDDNDPYQVLGVEHDASPDEVKSAYHKIIRENHPDALRSKNLPAETIALAEHRIRAANVAYESLGQH